MAPNQSGRLNEKERAEAAKSHGEREDMPSDVFLEPGARKYPVKSKVDGEWKYSRNLLLAAAREARMHGHEDLARRADAIRGREFGSTAQDGAISMTKLNSRRALLAAGAIAAYVRPKLAQDAKFDPVPALEGVNAKNFQANIPIVIEKVKSLTKGKLALDASPQELQSLLESLQGGGQEGEDEINPANPGLPDEMTGEAHDAEGGSAHAFLASKLSPEDHAKFKQLQGEDSARRRAAEDMHRRRAEDARKRLGRDETEAEMEEREKKESADDARKRLGRDETEAEMEEREKREAEDRKRRRAEDARKHAKDAENPQSSLQTPMPDGKDSHRRGNDKAMDEASVQSLVTLAVDEAVSKERVNQRAIQTALREVRPYVGDLNIAFDSAEQVYRRALEMSGESGLDQVHPSAYRKLLHARPLPGMPGSKPQPAMDSKQSAGIIDSLAKIAPGVKSVRMG
jgi:hypothetical protein